MRFKAGVSIAGLKPECLVGMILADQVFRGDLVVTSCLDGKHMEKSLHYKGLAFDWTFKALEERITRVGDEMEKNKEQLEAMKKMMGQVSDSFTVEKIGPGDAIAGYDD